MNSKAQAYINLVQQSLRAADQYQSRLSPYVLEIDGMSGRKMRHFVNNVFAYKPSLKYLEIGSWKGSTMCSALSNNSIDATSVENFSEFQFASINGKQSGSSRECFFGNTNHLLSQSGNSSKLTVIEEDSWKVDASKISGVDVYFYDGHHSYDSQYKAYTHYDQCLSDVFITFVDDYGVNPRKNQDVQRATQKAFDDLGYTVHKEWHMIPYTDGDLQASIDGWWNGVYVAVIEKAKK